MSMPLNDRDACSCYTSLQTEFNQKLYKSWKRLDSAPVQGIQGGWIGREQLPTLEMHTPPLWVGTELHRAPGYLALKGLPEDQL